jgi:ATP-binding cassette subfamily B protein
VTRKFWLMLAELSNRIMNSSRTRALLLLWKAAPALAVAAAAFIVAEGALPVLVLIAMGRVVAAIPPTVIFGLSSSDGHHLVTALAEGGIAYALSLLRGPAEDALTAAVTARVDALMQRRLVSAVSAPIGIAHLENREVLERLASVRDELMGGNPAGAPMALISQIGDRLTGILACLVLCVFRWWIGLELLVVWTCIRYPLAAGMRQQARRGRSAAEPMRRAWYLLGLAWRPAAAKEVRVFGLGDWIADRHSEEWLEGIQPAWASLRSLANRAWLAGAAVLAAYGVAVAEIGFAAYHREISLRTLATVLPMLPASMSVGSISYSDISLEQLLSAVPDLEALSSALAAVPRAAWAGSTAKGLPQRAIRIEQLGFSYQHGEQPVISDLSLDLPLGHSLGLVGVNGAGKTTLVTLLARMREPTEGRILVDGRPLSDLSAREWQQQVAVVYQDYARLPFTATENVAMFGHEADPQVLRRAAERAGALEVIESLPRGWDTLLSPHFAGGVDLSGGQWQRVALARALYAVETGSKVLVLDEPTAQLDVRGEAAFYDRFLELTAGITSIVISHRFASVRRADRIAVLDGGSISELGTHDELLTEGGTYAEMFRLQAERFAKSEGEPK